MLETVFTFYRGLYIILETVKVVKYNTYLSIISVT